MSKIFKNENEIRKIKESKEFKEIAANKKVNDFINDEQFKAFKEKYEEKSEEEILRDARHMSRKLKEQYGEKEYNKKIEDLKNIEKYLNPEQRKKLRRFIESLE